MSASIHDAVTTLLRELVGGADSEEAWVLNPEDPGLLRSLNRLTAEAASLVPRDGGASVAAHVDHLRYGLRLLNRWSVGEDPFTDADYGESWRHLAVTEREWEILRNTLRAEARMWIDAVRQPRELTTAELTGIIASVAHLAYHLGAIRQLSPMTSGPPARDARTTASDA